MDSTSTDVPPPRHLRTMHLQGCVCAHVHMVESRPYMRHRKLEVLVPSSSNLSLGSEKPLPALALL